MTYSVVIPAYNAAGTLREALDSVFAQTIPPAEVIVVDDGSTDDTAAIAAEDPRVMLLRQSNTGGGGATTAGIRAVSHPMLATLDSDDVWLAHKMQTQFAFLAANPDCDAVFADLRIFSTGGDRETGPLSTGWSRSTLVIATETARRVGPIIDPAGGRGDMIDWFARAREAGLVLILLDEVLALRRVRPDSVSYGRDKLRDRGYAQVAWLALQRRKNQGST